MSLSHFDRQDILVTAGQVSEAFIVNSAPPKAYALQVKGRGAAASAWDARLEGSLDGENWTTVLQHQTADGNAVVLFSNTNFKPVKFLRTRLNSVTLGSANALLVDWLAVQ